AGPPLVASTERTRKRKHRIITRVFSPDAEAKEAFFYARFIPKLTVRWKLRLRRTNQSHVSYRQTSLSTREYAERV
ncbi:MAG: hypothetical protein PV344_04305, partial [Anaplasma sp.]|nr:hypothetical protein [Anaplasma sp.]